MNLKTVCRKCIYEKITDEELNHCPVCNIDLGCAPLEKLRYFIIITPTNLVIYKWVTCFMNIVTLFLPKVITF
jgi:hypothetical protein